MKNLKLKASRAAPDLSQQELADKVGVSRQTINAIEKEIIIRRSICAEAFAEHLAGPWTNFSGKRKNSKEMIMIRNLLPGKGKTLSL